MGKLVVKKAAQAAKSAKGSDAAKVLSGALVGAALATAATLLLTPQSGKRLRQDIKQKSSDFYKSIAPRLKQIQKLGEKEYKIFVHNAAQSYSKAKKLSDKETKALVAEAHKTWQYVAKNNVLAKKPVAAKKPAAKKKTK